MGYFLKLVIIILLYNNVCNAEWITLTPIRNPINNSIIEDIESHTLPYYNILGKIVIYRNPHDIVNSVHEQTHRINSDIRNKYKVACGFYLFKNKGFIIKEHPKFTLERIANQVSLENRGIAFEQYLVKQRQYWNNDPLYILDECVAYLNGTYVGIETNNKHRAQDSFYRCLDLYYYGTICADISKKCGYAHQNELEEFLGVLLNRIFLIKDQLGQLGWLNSDHIALIGRNYD